jgi:hypothetical protein
MLALGSVSVKFMPFVQPFLLMLLDETPYLAELVLVEVDVPC